ncbi:MAG: hypothetical protein MR051_00450 [Lentisphaeria bacterium]|nr:hypothetical protein [Lentisphaeria bacterium]
MKNLLCLSMLILTGGCLVPHEDPAADAAVNQWNALERRDLPEILTPDSAAVRVSRVGQANQLRREFARLHRARQLEKLYRDPLRPNELRAAILEAECARIRLNALLGVRPDIRVNYDTAESFAVPPELPDPTGTVKAALFAAPDAAPDAAALTHARAVAAYDAAAHAATPEEKIERECARVLAVLDLADALNLPFPALGETEVLARRFDKQLRDRERLTSR